MTSQEPCLLLFLSVDVVGSTAYKNRHGDVDRVHPWLEFFTDFYKEFPEYLREAEKEKNSECSAGIWKTAGDELIFTAKLESHLQALKHVDAFRLAVSRYAEVPKKKGLLLGFKCCAWIAGFPVINAVVHPDGNLDKPDYIGPLVDAGFRLAKVADKRKFVVSVDLALLLATAAVDVGMNPVFYYDGTTSLQGVLSGRPYPVIWLDMLNGTKPKEELLLGIAKEQAQLPLLIEYCEDYIKSVASDHDLVRPYMKSCKAFNIVPSKHEEALKKMLGTPQNLLSQDEPPGGDKELSLDTTSQT